MGCGRVVQYINARIYNSCELFTIVCAALKHDIRVQLNSRWANHAIVVWSVSFHTSVNPLIKTLGIVLIALGCGLFGLDMMDPRHSAFIVGRATRWWRQSVSSGVRRSYCNLGCFISLIRCRCAFIDLLVVFFLVDLQVKAIRCPWYGTPPVLLLL